MKTEFRKAVIPKDIKRLREFDRKVFLDSDLFSIKEWRTYESYWMVVDGIRVGCCAFERHIDFREDIRKDRVNPATPGSLYISTTGILPKYQRNGFGQLMKCWEIAFARYNGFERIVTNTREKNIGMISLNKKFGFRIIRTTPKYYYDPADATVVMELRLS